MRKSAVPPKGSNALSSYCNRYFGQLSALLDALSRTEIEEVLMVLLKAAKNGNMIYFLGNGGSATTATHFSNDFNKFTSRSGKYKFRTLSLTDNISWFSALANDEGYSNVFVKQLETFLKKGDVVVGISASGNSENIIKAFEYASENGAVTVALVGFDGGRMKEISDTCVHIKTEKGQYGPVEDVHMVLDHLLSSYIDLL